MKEDKRNKDNSMEELEIADALVSYEEAEEDGFLGREIEKRKAGGNKREAAASILANADKGILKEERKGERVPVVLTVNMIWKLEASLSCGASEKEACGYAGISEKTLKRMKEKYPLLGRYMEAWKSRIVLKAMGVINDALAEGDKNIAKWVLERRSRKEWGSWIWGSLGTGKEVAPVGMGGGVNINISMDRVKELSRKVPLSFNGGGNYEVIEVGDGQSGSDKG